MSRISLRKMIQEHCLGSQQLCETFLIINLSSKNQFVHHDLNGKHFTLFYTRRYGMSNFL